MKLFNQEEEEEEEEKKVENPLSTFKCLIQITRPCVRVVFVCVTWLNKYTDYLHGRVHLPTMSCSFAFITTLVLRVLLDGCIALLLYYTMKQCNCKNGNVI